MLTYREAFEKLLSDSPVYVLEGDELIALKMDSKGYIRDPSRNIIDIYRFNTSVLHSGIMIGDRVVPAPLTKAPEVGDTYHFVNFLSEMMTSTGIWGGFPLECLLLQRGLVHKSNVAALDNARAILRLMR
jgi:hypothetical protein